MSLATNVHKAIKGHIHELGLECLPLCCMEEMKCTDRSLIKTEDGHILWVYDVNLKALWYSMLNESDAETNWLMLVRTFCRFKFSENCLMSFKTNEIYPTFDYNNAYLNRREFKSNNSLSKKVALGWSS